VELTARPKAYDTLNGNPPPIIADTAPEHSWWSKFFGGVNGGYQRIDSTRGAKPRKVSFDMLYCIGLHPPSDFSSQLTSQVPVKVEPKVYFANERTFLAWLHMAVTLASISVAIVA
jgi:hypothetical protein